MKINTDGLILKSSQTGEQDRLVTILTRDLGVVRAFAHGAAKSKGRSASATETLCYSTFTLTETKGTYSVSEATPVELFFELRSDIDRTALAQYFCEVVMNLAVEGEEASSLLRLILNSLYLLAKQLRENRFIKAVFELRMMTLSGFMPDTEGCCECGKTHVVHPLFDINGGVIRCDGCGGGFAITQGVLDAMRYICTAEESRIFSFEIGEESLRLLSDVAERYLLSQCDRSFTALDFYKNLPK